MPNTLPEWLARMEDDGALREPMNLRERLDALDRLELHAEAFSDPAWLARAESLRSTLEAFNQQLYAQVRQDMRAGRQAFAPWIDALEAAPAGDGYDYRDDLVSGVLAFDEPGEAAPLPPEMVFYQPTPARHVFDLIRRTPLNEHDVLMDLGSGMGIVPMLVATSTGARAIGIEREPAYADAARRCARSLGQARASFVCQDAREADMSAGTVFYLYTPFTGEVMRTVLAMLRDEAARRPLRVATFGPCTPVVAAEAWLRTDMERSTERLVLFSTD